MATINVPDSMVPLGYEVERPEVIHYLGANTPNDKSLCWIDVRVFIRRKPRLKRIVFTLAYRPDGTPEVRPPKEGEWFLGEGQDKADLPLFAKRDYLDCSPRQILTRTEEYA